VTDFTVIPKQIPKKNKSIKSRKDKSYTRASTADAKNNIRARCKNLITLGLPIKMAKMQK
jgi:hypothetical protein